MRIISPEGNVTTFPAVSDEYIGGGNITLNKNGILYGIDELKKRIYKIENGVLKYLSICEITADGTRVHTTINPVSLAIANDGTIYFTESFYDKVHDKFDNSIRKIINEGIVSPFSSGERGFENGNIANAKFNGPGDIQIF